MRASVVRHAVASTAILYLVGLVSPCALWDDFPVDRRLFGYEILAKGWAGPLAGDLLWYANPIFFYVLARAWTGRRVPMKWLWSSLLFLAVAAFALPVMHVKGVGIVKLSWFLLTAQDILFGAYLWAACMALGGLIALTAFDHPQRQAGDPAGGG